MRDLAVSFSTVWVLPIIVTCWKYYKHFLGIFLYNNNISIIILEEYHRTLHIFQIILRDPENDILAAKGLRDCAV